MLTQRRFMKKDSWSGNLGGGIVDDTLWRMSQGGEIRYGESWKRIHGGWSYGRNHRWGETWMKNHRGEIMEEESWRKTHEGYTIEKKHGGGIMLEKNNGGGVMDDESLMISHEEKSWRRDHGGEIMEQESWRIRKAWKGNQGWKIR
jgi:hypothetical protein